MTCQQDTEQYPKLWLNAMDRNLEGMRHLLESEQRININEKAGSANFRVSALYMATTLGFSEIVEILLQHNADMTEINNGMTPLNHVVFTNLADDTKIVRLLLLYGANTEARITGGYSGFSGETPLITSVRQGSIAFTQLLLDHNADVNTMESNWRGFTPLMVAAFYGRKDEVAMLLLHGSDIFAKSNFGWTAETCASINENNDIRTTLRALRTTWEDRALAVTMGHHERIGAGSQMKTLNHGLLRMTIPRPTR